MIRRRTTLVAAGLLVAVASAVPAGAATAPATRSSARPGGLIAFLSETVTDPCCGTDLFVVRANGDDERRLTRSGTVTSFAWGPHGRHLLFGVAHGITIMRWDGSHRTRLVGRDHPGASDPVWAPNGRSFVFLAGRPFVYSFATHRATPVHLPTSGIVNSAVWSPDSRALVVSAEDRHNHFQLWRYTLTTGAAQQLTSFRRGEEGSGAVLPAWSPAGGRILFVLQVYRDSQETEGTNLWAVRTDGTHLRQVTTSRRHGEHAASWAPHGDRFVDASSTGGDFSQPSTFTALVVRRPDGSTIRRVRALGDEDPSWSTTGRWIAAIRPSYGTDGGLEEKKPGLWLVRPDGTDAHRVLRSKLIDETPPGWEPSAR